MKTQKRTNRVPTLWTKDELAELDHLATILSRTRCDTVRFAVKLLLLRSQVKLSDIKEKTE